MELQFEPTPHIVQIFLNDEFLRISDQSYPVNSVNPMGSGRFNAPGQLAYYFASGLLTAKAEVYGGPRSGLFPGHQVHAATPGPYLLLDFNRLFNERPELKLEYFPSGNQGGWPACQELRNYLANLGCSGALYPSHKHESGVNTALWPLDGEPLPEQFFKPHS